MVTISEINEEMASGSLGGLGQTKSGQVFDPGSTGGVTQLKRGVKNPAVVGQLQLLLNSFGYNLPVTRQFDTATETAVKHVQEKLSMPQTGIFDAEMNERILSVPASSLGPTKKEAQIVAAVVAQQPSQMVVQAQPQIIEQYSGAMTPSGGGFLDNLINAVKSNPVIFAAGAVALVAAMYFVPRLIKGMHLPGKQLAPVQPLGLAAVRKPRKKTKGGKKFYVHFGGDGGPMSTVSFKSKAAAQKAVREAKAAGEPARMQEA